MDVTAQQRANDESSLLYPGWSVAGAAFVGVMTSFAPIVPYTFSLFLNPLHAAFGWQRATIDGAFALAAITVALASPLIGLLLDRFAPRRVILPCIFVLALALGSLSRLGGSSLQFYATFFVMGLAANGTAQFAYTRNMLTWFRRRRGLALAIMLTGSAVGSIWIPPATQWVIGHHGWRSAYLFLGAVALCGLPLTALVVRNGPDNQAHAEQTPQAGVTVGAALRSSAFWVLAVITILSAFSENGLVTNLAAILTEHGVTASIAAFALSVRGGSGIIARLFVGALIDRMSAKWIQTFVLTLTAVGMLILAFAGTSWMALLGAALLGIGLSSEADVAPYLMARYFGRKHFSVLFGLTWTAYAIGGAAGALAIGRIYDVHGSYEPRLVSVLGVVAFASAAVSLLLRDESGCLPDK